MQYWTYAQIRTKVEKDLDLEDELFIQPEELLGYANAGIDEAEAEIHSIYEDYFLTNAYISLIQGQDAYDLPTNIYANKIRAIVYVNANDTYQLPRIKHTKKFEDIEIANQYPSSNDYGYLLVNNAASNNPQMLLVPAAQETATNRLRIWYLRNANRLVDDSSICDIPEFVQFVTQFMKVRCYEKEGHPNLGFATQALESQRRLMIDTLSNMVPDEDTEIIPDKTMYNV